MRVEKAPQPLHQSATTSINLKPKHKQINGFIHQSEKTCPHFPISLN